MERITQAAGDEQDPGTVICQVEGNHYAWKPAPGDEFAGEMTHGRTEEELLAKLADGG
jgi:hypothetical protein